MHRFFLQNVPTTDTHMLINDKRVVDQLKKVLRFQKGEHFITFDGSGYEYELVFQELLPQGVRAEILEKRSGNREPKAQITLYQSLLKRDHFEYVLQKGVELGVSRFVPMITQRTIVSDVSANKILRYSKIIIEATEQCGGVRVAQLSPAMRFSAALREVATEGGINLIAWVGEKRTDLSKVLDQCGIIGCHFNIFVGPEGGFTDGEISKAKEYGMRSMNLGKRILRAETAGMAIVARILL